MKPLSDELYVKEPECPHCGHAIFIYDQGPLSYNQDTGDYSQKVTCSDCGKYWAEIFSLTGYEMPERSPRKGKNP